MRREPTDVRELTLLAALLLFVAGLCLQPMTESDLFFRLKVGSEILARRSLLGHNLFSFTAPGHPDLDLSWAFEVAVAALFRWGGFRAVVVAKSIWIVATFAGLFAIIRRRGAGPLSTTVVLAVVALVMRERFVERPHIVSFAGEVVVLAVLLRLPTARPWQPRAVCAFAVAMIVWANMHAGVFVGVMMSGLAALGWGCSRHPRERSLAWRALTVAAVIGAAATVTPVGPPGIVRYLHLHLVLPRLHAIDEFREATWRSDAPFITWLAAVVVFCACHRLLGNRLLILSPRCPAASWAELLPAAGMAVLGCLSVRFAADATLVSAPLMAVGLTAIVAATSSTRTWAIWVSPWRRAGAALVVAVLVAATVWPRLTEAAAGHRCCDVDVDATVLPLDALAFVERNGLRERMYNDFEIGSYLLFEGYPRYRVFVDPRLPAYPQEMHRLLGAFDLDRASWGAAMDRYGVDTALLVYAGLNRRVAWWDPSEWALVYRAADARVFVRRREAWRALIAVHEIPATFDFTVEQGATTRPLEDKPARSPVSDCEWQRRLGDLLFDLDQGRTTRAHAHFERALAPPGCLPTHEEAALAAWMGALELDAPDQTHALSHLNRALTLSSTDTRTRANRALVLERLGRRAEAAADWDLVAVAARGTALGNAAALRARKIDP